MCIRDREYYVLGIPKFSTNSVAPFKESSLRYQHDKSLAGAKSLTTLGKITVGLGVAGFIGGIVHANSPSKFCSNDSGSADCLIGGTFETIQKTGTGALIAGVGLGATVIGAVLWAKGNRKTNELENKWKFNVSATPQSASGSLKFSF